MDYIVPILLGLSILLFIISFFIKDPYKEIKNELDQFSMQQIQEIYQLKRKIKVLEEELLIDDREFQPSPTRHQHPKKEIHAIIKNQVWTLAQQGVSIDQIAKQSSLSIEDVKNIISEFSVGVNYE
ncbi:hypothetical protein ABE096_02670 [Robertmurraya massiliosenegalensis]|uniref:hypothetical protein n=1 Tax=Robertmurraya TaxID=2837507 RepID=UPI0039A5FFF6